LQRKKRQRKKNAGVLEGLWSKRKPTNANSNIRYLETKNRQKKERTIVP